MNKVIINGRLGKNPEVVTFKDGNKQARFSVATDESWIDKKSGERVTKTEWHPVVVRGNNVDIVEKYIKKGTNVLIDGKLQHRSYKKEGVTHYVTEIVTSFVKQLNNFGQPEQATATQTLTEDAPF
ncbi:MAG: single-stranded DNA-binding protein [Candidatus Thioglobus sp.]|jgi:single-strand DNA-binding protein